MAKSEEKPSPHALSLGNNTSPSHGYTHTPTHTHSHTEIILNSSKESVSIIFTAAGDTARNIEEMVQVRQMFQMREIESLRPGQISTTQGKNIALLKKKKKDIDTYQLQHTPVLLISFLIVPASPHPSSNCTQITHWGRKKNKHGHKMGVTVSTLCSREFRHFVAHVSIFPPKRSIWFSSSL